MAVLGLGCAWTSRGLTGRFSGDTMDRIKMLWTVVRSGLALACLLAFAPSASAETLLMPERDFLSGTSEVVWGVTTQANGTAFTIDYGDGSTSAGADCGADTVADRSYIACNHTYAVAGTFTVKLTVGAEEATVLVRVFNPAVLSAFDLRGVRTNKAIEDGLRSLWFNMGTRTGFVTNTTANWGSIHATSFAVLAFENHGYMLPSNPATAPTGIYQKYAVQPGLYYIATQMSQLSLPVQTAGSPCVGAGIEAAPCIGLYNTFDPGYSTAVSALPFAGSQALNRTFPAGLGGASGVYLTGKTFREALQRIMNSIAYGQSESTTPSLRGGWIYAFNGGQTDGSTVGWDLLALLDAAAAGITIPAFVKTEYQFAQDATYNTNGSFDYRGDGNPAAFNSTGFQKVGIGLQGLYFLGTIGAGNPKVDAAVSLMSAAWNAGDIAGGSNWQCAIVAANNKACAYGMYNAFKGLKLHGITTIPGVGRAAGPGAIPANDWYADYVDWLVTNQTTPTTLAGGHWAGLGFSCCNSEQTLRTATGLLILSPVTLISPDPVKFSTVGLRHGNPLTTDPITNPVGTDHTVTAVVESESGAPIPGVTVDFEVLSGPNAGKTGSGATGATGRTTFNYTDTAGPGTDRIQASVGSLKSNILEKIWVVRSGKCDIEPDGDVDLVDLAAIRAANGTRLAPGVDDPRDGNGDGRINVADYRYCQLRLTPAPVATGANVR